MRYIRLLSVATLILIFAPVLLAAIPVASTSELPYGPYPDRLILFLQVNEDAAIPMIEKGEMQVWLYNLRKPENIKRAEESARVTTAETFAGSLQLVVNPLATEGAFNPFSVQKVREGLNLLIDRNYIVSEILKGRGNPRWTTHRSVSPDYLRVIDFMKSLEAKYQHDFERAKAQIFEGLAETGATLREGKWYYLGEPITVNFLIRPEDERKDIGDYVAGQLEQLGLTVNRLYKPSRDAFRLWGALGPTRKGEWHIYTAGWANTAIMAYVDDDPWFFYSPDNMPLFSDYSGPPLLREAMDRLNNAEYKSLAERNDLVKRINELALEDGVHIWLVDQLQIFPSSAELSTYVRDLYGGVWSLWALRTLRYKDGAGGTIRAGNRAMFIEGFNPGAGFSWLYDVFVQWLVSDPAVWPHPHTGRYIPVRSSFSVETAGAEGQLSVPADALKYDVNSEVFVPVGSGVNAKSKVYVNLTLGKWHNGIPVTKADLMYYIAEVYKLTTSGTELYDSVAASPSRVNFRNYFRGIRFTGESGAEIYIDYWHVDDSYIAYAAIYPIFPDTPWELWAIMNRVVANKRSAWSVDRADELGVEMLDLTKGPTLSLLKSAYDELASANFIPKELTGLVDADEAKARWRALGEWYSSKGHFWVSNGPYMFGKADPGAYQVVLDAFREYPYRADVWDSMLEVKVPEMRVAAAPSEVVPGLKASFNITMTVAGEPYGRAKVKYILTDPRNIMVSSGDAISRGGGVFSVVLSEEDTVNLGVGAYTLTVVGVGEEAALPLSAKATFMVIPALAYFERMVLELKTELATKIAALDKAAATKSDVEGLKASLAGAQSAVNTLMGVTVISLMVAVAAIMLVVRRRG